MAGAREVGGRWTRLPVGWDTSNDEYEYVPLRLPSGYSRKTGHHVPEPTVR